MCPLLPSQYPSRAYHNWGRPLPPCPQALWARRSSWNSLGGCRPCSSSQSASPIFTPASARSFYGYGLASLSGVVGGSLRVRGPRASSSPRRHHHHLHLPHHHHHRSHPDEEESLLQPPVPLLPGPFVPRRDRRALSLELPNLLQVPGGGGPPHPPPIPANHLLPPVMFHMHQRKKSFSSSGGMDGVSSSGAHQDCNGKTPLSQLLQPPLVARRLDERGDGTNSQLIADVFPQVNNRGKEREDLDDEIDYVSHRQNALTP